MSKPEEIRARVYLASANTDLLALALGDAVERGAAAQDVCVLLIDTRDEVGHELAAVILERGGKVNLAAEEERALRRDMIPTGIAVLQAPVLEAVLRGTHPQIAEAVGQRPVPGSVRVVVIASNGVTLMHLPIAPVRTVSRA